MAVVIDVDGKESTYHLAVERVPKNMYLGHISVGVVAILLGLIEALDQRVAGFCLQVLSLVSRLCSVTHHFLQCEHHVARVDRDPDVGQKRDEDHEISECLIRCLSHLLREFGRCRVDIKKHLGPYKK